MRSYLNKRNLMIILAFMLLFLFPYLPLFPNMLMEAKQVIGIFLGVLLLWLNISIEWPSLLCLAALAFVPGLNINMILANSFGNSTFAFLLFTFMCTYALSKTSYLRNTAILFITSKTASKGPWFFAMLFFSSIIFLGCFISPTVLFVIYLPIIEEIYHVLKLEKGDSFSAMLMIGLVICCGISSGMTPIAHVFPLLAMGAYTTATGLSISYAAYMGFAIPVGLLSLMMMMLIFRFILRPDTSSLKHYKIEAIKFHGDKLKRNEKIILAIFIGIIILWIAPGVIKPFLPTVAKLIDSYGTAMPPLLGVIAMSIFTYEHEPLLNFGEAMSKGVSWPSLILCASTLALGSALTNPQIGLIVYLQEGIAPVLSSLPVMILVFIFTFWAALQTNLSSNMVTVTVVSAVALPITLAMNGSINPAAVISIIGMMAAYAFATPPAMPCVAIAGSSGWTNVQQMMKYGFLIMAVSVLITVFIGYPLACLFMG